MVLTFSLRVLGTIGRGLIRGRDVKTPISSSDVITTVHRCWPTDIDFFMHMNNAIYFRAFELAQERESQYQRRKKREKRRKKKKKKSTHQLQQLSTRGILTFWKIPNKQH